MLQKGKVNVTLHSASQDVLPCAAALRV